MARETEVRKLTLHYRFNQDEYLKPVETNLLSDSIHNVYNFDYIMK